MLQEEFKELTGLAKAPVYWDRRYTKNLDKLSKPVYTVALETDVEIVMRDGVKLYCDVYHPAEIEKAPALIAWSAYGKEMQAMRHGSLPGRSNYFDHSLEAGDMDFYVQRGYTFIIPNPAASARARENSMAFTIPRSSWMSTTPSSGPVPSAPGATAR